MATWAPHVERAVKEIETRFGLKGGTYPGHGEDGSKFAADFWTTSKAMHDKVLHWVIDNENRLNIKYIISWRRIWSDARSSEGIRPYTRYVPPASASQLHTNHVHISFDVVPIRGEADMPLNTEDMAKIKKLLLSDDVLDAVADAVLKRDGLIVNNFTGNAANTHVGLATAVTVLGERTKPKP